MAFRTASGGKSDKLADAQLLPLSAIGINQASPYAGTSFTKPSSITYDDHKKRRFPLAFHRYDDASDYVVSPGQLQDWLPYPNGGLLTNPDGITSSSDLSPWYMDSQVNVHEVESSSGKYYGGSSSFKKPLYPAQSMMLGASGYLNRYVMPRGWLSTPSPSDA